MKIKGLYIVFAIGFVLALVVIIKAVGHKKVASYAHILIQQEPDSLNPLFTSMSAASEIQRAIYTPMVEIDSKGKPIALLVKEIPSLENNNVTLMHDGKVKVVWTFKDNLLWEDAHPLGADDVIFTWKLIMDKRVWVRNRNLEKRIHSMQKDDKDPNKLIVIWKKPYAYYYKGHHILPKHILEKEYNKNPAKLHLSTYNRKPIGNGPFKLAKWAVGNYIMLTKNKYYHETTQKGNLEGIWYQFIGNTNSIILSILSGYADAVSPVGLSFDQAVSFKEAYKERFKVHIKDGIVWEHIDFNLDHKLLKDIRIRKAIMYGIDRKQMVKSLFDDKLKVADSWLPPLHPGYSDKITKYEHSKEKAIALLKEAGFGYINKELIRENKDGTKLEFDLITTAGNKLRIRVQIAIKQALKDIGINININKNQNAITLFGETMPKRKFELVMYAWIFSPLSDGEEMWSYDAIPNEGNKYIGDNIPGYKNKTIYEIHKKIPITLDKKEQQKLFQREQQIWTNELPALPLYFRAEVSITKKSFANWQPTGTDTPITWNAKDWQILKN